jgi:Xaa-Pro aminopeptidase
MDKKFFIKNRQVLVERIKCAYPNRRGSVFLWAHFESQASSFVQDSTFYYFSGIDEPGVVMRIELDGTTTLFIPRTQVDRGQWVADALDVSESCAKRLGVDHIAYLGDACQGYSLSPRFDRSTYNNLMDELARESTIFACYPTSSVCYTGHCMALDRLSHFMSDLSSRVIDISSIVDSLRRVKQLPEIEHIFKAVQVTAAAIFGAARAVRPQGSEHEVRAAVEYVCATSGAEMAFPTIVAGGKNATILHYAQHSSSLNKGDMVVVDCGARIGHYCADLTRTFPVDGVFTKEQRRLYSIVLSCQDYVASLVKPGMFLHNQDQPEKSLHHQALDFFDKHGLKKYFVHGVGHFLGLDPHDVGNMREPLQEGDVITLEPGVYIPEQHLGIRIEDNYWVIKDGVHCLSDDVYKAHEEIEQLMQHSHA